jgi:hypothetical protein
MWPFIFVFGGVALVAYTFTKVGKKSPLDNSASIQSNIAQIPVRPAAAKPKQASPAAPQPSFVSQGPTLVEMTPDQFAAAQAAGGHGPISPSFADVPPDSLSALTDEQLAAKALS